MLLAETEEETQAGEVGGILSMVDGSCSVHVWFMFGSWDCSSVEALAMAKMELHQRQNQQLILKDQLQHLREDSKSWNQEMPLAEGKLQRAQSRPVMKQLGCGGYFRHEEDLKEAYCIYIIYIYKT